MLFLYFRTLYKMNIFLTIITIIKDVILMILVVYKLKIDTNKLVFIEIYHLDIFKI